MPPDDAKAASAVAPCPLKSFVVRVKVLDAEDQPAALVPVALRKSPSEVLASRTNREGEAAFPGLEQRTYELTLSAQDASAWRLLTTEPLAEKSNVAPAAFSAPAVAGEADESMRIGEGDGVSRIADQRGLPPTAIWDHDKNKELRASREHMNLLDPKRDLLFVPAKRLSWVQVSGGSRVLVKTSAGASFFKARFLDVENKPRTKVPYLLSVKTSDGTPHEDSTGETDGGGFVTAPVPAQTTEVLVRLGKGAAEQRYVFHMGRVGPLDTDEGARVRLGHLGYALETDRSLTEAVVRFQRAEGLEPSGRLDDATRAKLKAAHQS
jgi:hypothetical protein